MARFSSSNRSFVPAGEERKAEAQSVFPALGAARGVVPLVGGGGGVVEEELRDVHMKKTKSDVHAVRRGTGIRMKHTQRGTYPATSSPTTSSPTASSPAAMSFHDELPHDVVPNDEPDDSRKPDDSRNLNDGHEPNDRAL